MIDLSTQAQSDGEFSPITTALKTTWKFANLAPITAGRLTEQALGAGKVAQTIKWAAYADWITPGPIVSLTIVAIMFMILVGKKGLPLNPNCAS